MTTKLYLLSFIAIISITSQTQTTIDKIKKQETAARKRKSSCNAKDSNSCPAPTEDILCKQNNPTAGNKKKYGPTDKGIRIKENVLKNIKKNIFFTNLLNGMTFHLGHQYNRFEIKSMFYPYTISVKKETLTKKEKEKLKANNQPFKKVFEITGGQINQKAIILDEAEFVDQIFLEMIVNAQLFFEAAIKQDYSQLKEVFPEKITDDFLQIDNARKTCLLYAYFLMIKVYDLVKYRISMTLNFFSEVIETKLIPDRKKIKPFIDQLLTLILENNNKASDINLKIKIADYEVPRIIIQGVSQMIINLNCYSYFGSFAENEMFFWPILKQSSENPHESLIISKNFFNEGQEIIEKQIKNPQPLQKTMYREEWNFIQNKLAEEKKYTINKALYITHKEMIHPTFFEFDLDMITSNNLNVLEYFFYCVDKKSPLLDSKERIAENTKRISFEEVLSAINSDQMKQFTNYFFNHTITGVKDLKFGPDIHEEIRSDPLAKFERNPTVKGYNSVKIHEVQHAIIPMIEPNEPNSMLINIIKNITKLIKDECNKKNSAAKQSPMSFFNNIMNLASHIKTLIDPTDKLDDKVSSESLSLPSLLLMKVEQEPSIETDSSSFLTEQNTNRIIYPSPNVFQKIACYFLEETIRLKQLVTDKEDPVSSQQLIFLLDCCAYFCLKQIKKQFASEETTRTLGCLEKFLICRICYLINLNKTAILTCLPSLRIDENHKKESIIYQKESCYLTINPSYFFENNKEELFSDVQIKKSIIEIQLLNVLDPFFNEITNAKDFEKIITDFYTKTFECIIN